MAVKNSLDRKYANGSIGVVEEFEPGSDYPVIAFQNGRTVTMQPDTWELRDGDKKRASITQIPLRLAWAITVHKSQGMTLDAAYKDGKITAKGMLDDKLEVVIDAMLKKDSRFKSMSGSVRLTLPDNDGFIMKYSSMSGSVSNRFTGLRAEKSGTNTYKNGGITLTLESMSGSVSID